MLKPSEKRLHCQLFSTIDQPHIDKTSSLTWLKSSTLKRSTESILEYFTKYIKKHIYKTIEDGMCRACNQNKETIQHVISGCSILSPTKCTKTHDNACNMFTFKMFQSGTIMVLDHSSKTI